MHVKVSQENTRWTLTVQLCVSGTRMHTIHHLWQYWLYMCLVVLSVTFLYTLFIYTIYTVNTTLILICIDT